MRDGKGKKKSEMVDEYSTRIINFVHTSGDDERDFRMKNFRRHRKNLSIDNLHAQQDVRKVIYV